MHRSKDVMAWNVFKFCTALRSLGSNMILLVLGVVGVTYYIVVLTSYGPTLYNGGLTSIVAIAVLILFHGLLVMLLWSYFSFVLADPGGMPPNWRPIMDKERREGDPLIGSDFGVSSADASKQRVRCCQKCSQMKPPRCHHCSVCRRRKLKMDHHCVWVVNCAGALNYKYFLIFLFYTFLETSLVTSSLLPHFIAIITTTFYSILYWGRNTWNTLHPGPHFYMAMHGHPRAPPTKPTHYHISSFLILHILISNENNKRYFLKKNYFLNLHPLKTSRSSPGGTSCVASWTSNHKIWYKSTSTIDYIKNHYIFTPSFSSML
ncbi:hypothetical protein PVL29_021395 [Vitis rotundifolia]|uniref:S-acyltransferase n=1 Tax=Vitis rotundifolia TaxID=103349 RepID=A0AA39DC08_VITRO|nr:hypothetical protein PVL29_021395 [Vitis rotundifolia]